MERGTLLRTLRCLALAVTAIAAAGCGSSPPVHPSPKEALPHGPAQRDAAASARIHTELAAAYYQAGQTEAARDVIAFALAADPGNATALGLAALIQGELGDHASAQKLFASARQIAPSDPDVRHNYGAYLCRTGQHAEGVAMIQSALSTPGYARTAVSHSAVGRCRFLADDHNGAVAAYDRALAEDPAFHPALFGKAEAVLDAGDPALAHELMRLYVRTAPVTAETLWLEYRIAQRLGNRQDALMLAADIRTRFPQSRPARQLDPPSR